MDKQVILYLTLFFVLINCNVIISQYISFPYLFDFPNAAITINATISSFHIPIKFCIDLSGNYSYIREELYYSPKHSLTLTISNQEANYLFFQGNVSSDIVSFSSKPTISRENITFIYTNRYKYTSSEEILFPSDLSCLTISRSPLSFLDHLFTQRYITKKMIHFGTNTINIGDITPILHNKNKQWYKTQLITYANNWAFNVTGIGICKGKETPQINTEYNNIGGYYKHYANLGYYISILSSKTNDILVLPENYKDFFIRKYFVIKRKMICDVIRLDRETEGIGCNSEEIASLPLISLIIDNRFALHFKANQLFNLRSKIRKKMFRIKFMKGLYDIILGNRFINAFNIILNPEERYIGFSADDIPIIEFVKDNQGGVINIKNDSSNGDISKIWAYYVCLITISLFGVLLLLYIKMKIEK